MRGMHYEDDLPLPKYVFGISGGSWFTFTYMFADQSISDAELLGPYHDPADLSFAKLREISKKCMLAAPANAMMWDIIADLFKDKVQDWVWTYQQTIYKTFLEPVGVPQNASIAWSKDFYGLSV